MATLSKQFADLREEAGDLTDSLRRADCKLEFSGKVNALAELYDAARTLRRIELMLSDLTVEIEESLKTKVARIEREAAA